MKIKKIYKIILLPFVFILYGCPPVYFYEYIQLDNLSNEFIGVKVGYLHQFIDKKEKILISNIQLKESKNNYKIIVFSKKIGYLNLIHYSDNNYFFAKNMPFNNVKKNLNYLENDTIWIEMEKNNQIKQSIRFYLPKEL